MVVHADDMVLEFLANGFEEIEALTPVDVLRRAGIEVKTVSLNDTDLVHGAHGIEVHADITASDLGDNIAPDMVILPGGMPGASNLDGSPVVDSYLKKTSSCGGYIAAICAAPMVLGRRGLLSGRNAVCYPGFEKELRGARISEKKVVVDDKVITAAGMGVALEFALTLVRVLKGEEASEAIRASVIAK